MLKESLVSAYEVDKQDLVIDTASHIKQLMEKESVVTIELNHE